MNGPYRNITISGLPGSGSTTLLRKLKEELQFDGWKGFSGGEFMRSYAEERGLFQEKGDLHHDASHYEDEFDRKIDMGMRAKLQNEEKWILESWLSGFLGQGVKGVLKILMICSDPAVRIDRIVNRDHANAQEVKQNIHDRYVSNYTKWSRMYAPEWQEWVVKPGLFQPNDKISFWNPKLYDLVIDTYSHNQEQSLDMVLEALKAS